jgi:hypothetical protein
VADPSEHDNESSGSIKGGEVDSLINCQILKKDLAPWNSLVRMRSRSAKLCLLLVSADVRGLW